ncbi:hypothetical protein CEXT_411461 [Caerostris extrusa]|uniref:Uncharacterized protein n=1 Tax=Caerostris extrusa TaxID=172846 RepID=A0AAV4QTM2_CAEEX|nr:hypothetical protein CEXT_411461 [Caerostris extrusa]
MITVKEISEVSMFSFLITLPIICQHPNESRITARVKSLSDFLLGKLSITYLPSRIPYYLRTSHNEEAWAPREKETSSR